MVCVVINLNWSNMLLAVSFSCLVSPIFFFVTKLKTVMVSKQNDKLVANYVVEK